MSSRIPGKTRRARATGYERIATVIGGGALLWYGLRHPSWRRAPAAAAGGYLIYHGTTGQHGLIYEAVERVSSIRKKGIEVHRSLTIEKPVDQVYRTWRDFEQLPRFMYHLESVTPSGHNRYRWVARGPVGTKVEWEADITHEQENRRIAWRSTPESTVRTEGEVEFREAPGNRGTEVSVHLAYHPPGERGGAAIAKLLGADPDRQIREDLRRFKRIVETGEIPTIFGQPSGRVAETQRPMDKEQHMLASPPREKTMEHAEKETLP